MAPSSSRRRASVEGRPRMFSPLVGRPSSASSTRAVASVPLPGAPIEMRRPASEASPSVTGRPR